jgi:hypothetical protein
MRYEDLVTLKAFLGALENLDQPLPEDLQADLGVIVSVLAQEPTQPQLPPPATPTQHFIQELGWTRGQAAAIRDRLAAFREDWDEPGMEIYDDL